MATRVEGLRSHVQDMVKQAVVQMEGVRGVMVRTVAERLELDVDALRNRGNAVLRGLGKQSARLAEQDMVPLPNVVRSTLGKVNSLLDGLIDQLAEESANEAASVSEPVGSRADASEEAKSSESNNRRGNGSSRPRKSVPKTGTRGKSRRQPTTN